MSPYGESGMYQWVRVNNFRGLITIAQIARLQRAYCSLSICFTSNRGGSPWYQF